ncbi:MAG: hypothetical protein ACRDRX_06300 [Pseudonocardiaceae bacterium]
MAVEAELKALVRDPERIHSALSRQIATVVTIPELAGQTFIELETLADAGDVDAASDIVRSVLRELGIEDSDLTTQAYTDAVAAQRGAAQ